MSDEYIKKSDAIVVERKRGEWMPVPDKRQHFCSECRKKAKRIVVGIKLVDNYYCHKSEPITEYDFGELLSDFCYFCGADMRGDDNDD